MYVAFSVLVLDCAFSFDIAMLGDTDMLIPMYMREHGPKHMLRISWGLCLSLTSPVGNAIHCSLNYHKFIGITTNTSVLAQGLVSNLITAGHGREAAFAAAVLGDNALMEKAWQDTGMLAEAVLHAQVSSLFN